MNFDHRACPACTSTEANVETSSHIDAASQSWAELRSAWSGLFSEKTFFPYARCLQCGTLYAPTYFTGPQLDELYAEMAPNMAETGSAEPLRRTQEGYFDFIEKRAQGAGGYLELGPDVGTFARRCARSVRFNHVWMVEPNRVVWDELATGFEAGTITVSESPDLIDQIPDGSLKIAVAIHVLDHLVSPVDVLKRIRPKMAADGVFLSVTHNEGSLLAKVLGPRWPAFCLQHPQLYNSRSIREIYARSGFEPVAVKRTYNVFPFGFLVRQGLWAFLRLSIRQLGIFERFSVRLRLGNIVAIAVPQASK